MAGLGTFSLCKKLVVPFLGYGWFGYVFSVPEACGSLFGIWLLWVCSLYERSLWFLFWDIAALGTFSLCEKLVGPFLGYGCFVYIFCVRSFCVPYWDIAALGTFSLFERLVGPFQGYGCFEYVFSVREACGSLSELWLA